MKLSIFIVSLIVLVSCQHADEKADNSYYVESRLSFYDPYDKDFFLREWIRKPSHITAIHESFKKYGYSHIFANSEFDEVNFWIPGMYDWVADKTGKNLIDSLIKCYPHYEQSPKYYKQFWMRRKHEQNDSVVFNVLKEVKLILLEKKDIAVRQQFVNDTIVALLKIQNDSITDISALTNFEYLKQIGLNKSAYNLLYERYAYYAVKWDTQSLKRELKKDTINCCPRALIEDDTK